MTKRQFYYVIADSYATAKNSPHLEIFRQKGIEVLLLSDPIDEWVTSHLAAYEDKPLQSVNKGELDLGDVKDDKKKESEKEKQEIRQAGKADKKSTG